MTMLRFPLEKQNADSSSSIMLTVLLAMIPGILASFILFGFGVLFQLIIALSAAFICELSIQKIRKRSVRKLGMLTSFLSAALLAVSIPATAPWWLIFVGVCFAIIVGKHIFGGVGNNIFNPMVVGFCILYTSFAYQMSLYPNSYIGLSDTFNFIFPTSNLVDANTGATLLGQIKANGLDIVGFNLFDRHIIFNLSWLIGGIYLLLKRVADWVLTVTFLLTFIILNIVFSIFISDISALQHLVLGSTILTAFFIITDPTTAPSSNKGRIVYAVLIGLFAVIIRQFSKMPDSLAFAILLGNMCMPLIDEYTKPKYGAVK